MVSFLQLTIFFRYERMEDAPSSQEADIVMRFGIEDDAHNQNQPGSSRIMLQYENISTNQGSQDEIPILYETVETDLNVSMDETSRFPPTYNETATQTTVEVEHEYFNILEYSNVETQTEDQVKAKKDVAVCTSPLYKDIGVGTNDRVVEEEEKGSQTEDFRTPSRKRRATEGPSTSEECQLPEKDEDEVFALQMVRPLKKLAPEKRAIAKAKLLTYLIKLECGLDVDI